MVDWDVKVLLSLLSRTVPSTVLMNAWSTLYGTHAYSFTALESDDITTTDRAATKTTNIRAGLDKVYESEVV